MKFNLEQFQYEIQYVINKDIYAIKDIPFPRPYTYKTIFVNILDKI